MTKTPAKPGRYTAICLILMFVILVADQYTKWLVTETSLRADIAAPEVAAGPGVEFKDWFLIENKLPYFSDSRYTFRAVEIAPWLNFTMVWNQGVSFGLFNQGEATWILIGLSSVISLGLLGWLAVATRLRTGLCISLIVGGAAGNIMDRVRFGAVADFIDVHWQGYHWPAFNLADSYIVLGAAMLALDSLCAEHGAKELKEGTTAS